MIKRRLVDVWRDGNRAGHRVDEVLAELKRLDFSLVLTTKGHYKIWHPKLDCCPHFPMGFILINPHAFGRQGEVHPAAIRDILKALDWIEQE